MVAVAIGGAAVIGGVTSVVAGNKAANATKQAAADSAGVEKYIYDTTRSDYAPYRDVGYGALGKLATLYGVPAPDTPSTTPTTGGVAGNYGGTIALPGGGTFQIPGYTPATTPAATTPAPSSGKPDYGGFYASPGYQFRVDEAMRAIQGSAAARGLLQSGATEKAINRQVQGIASDEFNSYANHLAALAGVGQTATGQVAQAGQNYAAGASNAIMAAGNANATAYQNTGSAINGAVQNLAGAYLYNRGFNAPQPSQVLTYASGNPTGGIY